MKRNKLTYMFIFAFVFLGFMNNVNASCCYVKDGKYTYDSSISGSVCSNNLHGDASSSLAQCNAKNPDVCCDTKTGTVKNGLTDTQCASNGYKKVAAGTCYKTVTETICASDMTESECAGRGEWDRNNNCCKYTSTTNVNQENNAATNPNNPGNQYNNQDNNNNNNNNNNATPQEKNGDGSSLWDNTKPAPSIEGTEIDISCGGLKDVLGLIKTIYNLIRYATPVVLIILGSVDFFKAVMAGKEDDIKKNQKRFVSRLILAVAVFLLLSVFELIASILSKAGVGDGESWLTCWNSLAKILSI